MNSFFISKKPKLQKRKIVLPILFSLLSFQSFSQDKPKDSLKPNQLDDVLVSAVRVDTKTPVSFSNFSKAEISKRNLGQDIPVLLNFLPSVVTTTDAGNGVGYTGIRVRGSDATRVNVTINGIPYNDAESQGTFWVNMPDFASSLENIQLQRGVGTSTNGSSAFGASLNMLTDNYSKKSSGEISNSYGSFNTHKHTLKFSTGLMNDKVELAGRLSQINSDGYVDRATSRLKSYFLQGTFVGKTTLIKALVFGGTEKTYQAWSGVDATTLSTNRTYNSNGEKYDENGNLLGFYDNQTDNYQQDHAQLHWSEKISANWSTNLAFHYTKGKGFYEEYVDDWKYTNVFEFPDSQLSFLGLDPMVVNGTLITSTDYIRKKWLDNDFYGTTFSANYKSEGLDFIFGGAANKYEGGRFNEVTWAQYPSNSESGYIYYDNDATKTDGNIFSKVNLKLSNWFSVYGDLQLRKVNYRVDSPETGLVNDSFTFFNPKGGFNVTVNKSNTIYFSYARANREPNRNDYENGTPKPEQLDDLELGYRYSSKKLQLNLNGFYMKYKDQLVLTGAVDNVGSPIRENSGNSYRVGVEFDATTYLSEKWTLSANATLSDNINEDFVTDASGTIQNLGNTNIAYSPKFIAGSILTFKPIQNASLSLMSKFVGNQYLSNLNDSQSMLNDYFVNDINFVYFIPVKKVFKQIMFNVQSNNIFNRSYVSNAIDYGGGFIYYFPQAGANVIVGMTLKF
jgi:iron complex outermembrane receptor protein